MTILKFDGVVTHEWIKNEYGRELSRHFIGGRDFIREIEAADFKGRVAVALCDENFTGDLYVYESTPGYSEWTPPEANELFLADGKQVHDIHPRISSMEGKIITLWIADEPINTLDPPPVR